MVPFPVWSSETPSFQAKRSLPPTRTYSPCISYYLLTITPFLRAHITSVRLLPSNSFYYWKLNIGGFAIVGHNKTINSIRYFPSSLRKANRNWVCDHQPNNVRSQGLPKGSKGCYGHQVISQKIACPSSSYRLPFVARHVWISYDTCFRISSSRGYVFGQSPNLKWLLINS